MPEKKKPIPKIYRNYSFIVTLQKKDSMVENFFNNLKKKNFQFVTYLGLSEFQSK